MERPNTKSSEVKQSLKEKKPGGTNLNELIQKAGLSFSWHPGLASSPPPSFHRLHSEGLNSPGSDLKSWGGEPVTGSGGIKKLLLWGFVVKSRTTRCLLFALCAEFKHLQLLGLWAHLQPQVLINEENQLWPPSRPKERQVGGAPASWFV